jgi:hypothetical protein
MRPAHAVLAIALAGAAAWPGNADGQEYELRLPGPFQWVAFPELRPAGFVTTTEGSNMSHCSYHAESVGYDRVSRRVYFTARVSDALLQQQALIQIANPFYEPRLVFAVVSTYQSQTRFQGRVVLDALPMGQPQLSMSIPLDEPTDGSRWDVFGGVSWFPVRQTLRSPGSPPPNAFIVFPGDNWFCAVSITH